MPDTGRNPARDNDAGYAGRFDGKPHAGTGRNGLNHVPPGLADLPVDRPAVRLVVAGGSGGWRLKMNRGPLISYPTAAKSTDQR